MNDPALALAWGSSTSQQSSLSEISALYKAWIGGFGYATTDTGGVRCRECGYLNIESNERCDMCDAVLESERVEYESEGTEDDIDARMASADATSLGPASPGTASPRTTPEHWRGWETGTINQQLDKLPPDHVTLHADYQEIVQQSIPLSPHLEDSRSRDDATDIDRELSPKQVDRKGNRSPAVSSDSVSCTSDPKCQNPAFSIELMSVKQALDHWEVEEEFPSDFLNYSHDEMEVAAEVVVDGSAKRVMEGFVDMSVVPDDYRDNDQRKPLPTESLAKRIHQRQNFTNVCQSPWLVLRNSGSTDTGFLPLRWSAVALQGETTTDEEETSDGESNRIRKVKQSVWQALRCKTYLMPVPRRSYLNKQKTSRVCEVQRWTTIELPDPISTVKSGSGAENSWQRRAFHLQKKIRTIDTPMCSTYFIEYSIRITPRGLDQCTIQASWAPVWLMHVGPLRNVISAELRKGVFSDSDANLHVIASKIAHWNALNAKTAAADTEEENSSRISGSETPAVKDDASEVEPTPASEVEPVPSSSDGVPVTANTSESADSEEVALGGDDLGSSPHKKKRWSMTKLPSIRRRQRDAAPALETKGDDKSESSARKKWKWSISKVKSQQGRKGSKAKTEGDVGEPTLNSELAHGSIDGNDDGSSQLAADNDFEERIIDFYKSNNPSKLSDLPELLEKYRGREEVLLELLICKYRKDDPLRHEQPPPAETPPANGSDPDDPEVSKDDRAALAGAQMSDFLALAAKRCLQTSLQQENPVQNAPSRPLSTSEQISGLLSE